MSDVETLLKTTIGEMERLLTSKTVIGEPIKVGEKAVVPLLSVGAGFGAGVGTGKGKDESTGGGAGGGFGIKPVAVIVIEEDHVSIEPVKEAKSSMIESVMDKLPHLIEKHMEDREKRQKESGKEIKVE